MKKILAFLLAAAMMLTLPVIAVAADENRQYTFELTANGASAVTAETGDVIDVVCTLKRTDGASEDLMFALQNNITWDNTFFNMVPGSLNMKNDVDGIEKAMMGNINFVAAGRYSMNGDKWSCENVICSFRLKVIATTGVGRIESRDACVVGQDSSIYPVTVNSVTVTVSNRCEITYNPNNGESSSAVTAEAGGSITLPAAPEKEGYRFKCWRWDNKDYAEKSGYTVSTNADFIAIWDKLAEYTLTFDSKGGAAVESIKALDGKTVNLPSAPVRKGYTFTAWVADDKEYAAGSSYKVTGNVLFTAKWEQSATGETPVTPDNPGETPVTTDNPDKIAFTDVASNAYYYDAVLWAVKNKITEGTGASAFSPDTSCTRAQMATFLWRAAGSPEPKLTENPFTDVKQSDYYFKAVLWAVEKGITKGTDATTFSPNAVCSRGQMVTFLYRLAGEPPVNGSNPFADVKSGDYFHSAVLWATERNITKGTGAATFDPEGICSRAQIVTLMYRYYN